MATTRRKFLLGSTALAAGGGAFGWYWLNRAFANPLEKVVSKDAVTLTHFITISRENRVAVAIPRAEMGQGVTGVLAALVAEELDLPWASVETFNAPAGGIYGNKTAFLESLPFLPHDQSGFAEAVRATTVWASGLMGMQFTGASTSVRDLFVPMRSAAAAAAQVLKAEAAAKWGVDAKQLTLADRHVVHGERRVPFGELAAGAAARELPTKVALKPVGEWKLLGKSISRPDVPSKTDGTAKYGIDVERPDMLVASIRQNPHLGGAPVLSVNDEKAKSMKGVVRVVKLADAVAVVADRFWRAEKAAATLDVKWAAATYPPSTEAQFSELAALCDAKDGDVFRDDGDASVAYEQASKTVEAEYRVPYLAHFCMEPMNAVAHVKGGEAHVWTGTQVPTNLRARLADALHLDPSSVHVHRTLLGTGFGRRGEIDFAIQAALIAKETSPKPVKLIWNRAEDTTHDAYRPAMVGKYRGAVGADGFPEIVQAKTGSQDVMLQYLPRLDPNVVFPLDDVTSAQGAHDQPYSIDHFRVQHKSAFWSLPVGTWRSVGFSSNGFMMESFVDELAQLGGKDPVEVRLHLLRDYPVGKRLIEAVAEMSGWGQPLPKGRGRGIAFQAPFGSHIAQVVEVTVDEERGLVIDKVFSAVDVGRVLNPENVRAQIESGVIFGLSSALLQKIDFENGRVQQTNFHDFDSLRMFQTPKIETRLFEEQPHIGGVGEVGVTTIAPAVVNAVFAATGRRIRTLPVIDTMKVHA